MTRPHPSPTEKRGVTPGPAEPTSAAYNAKLGSPARDPQDLPFFLTAEEAATLLRTTRAAIYARAERGLLPGAVRDGRRLLVRRDELLRSLEERRAASPGGTRR